jgi:hypothetical protein
VQGKGPVAVSARDGARSLEIALACLADAA